MQLPAASAQKLIKQNSELAGRLAPAVAGDSLLVSRFLPTRQYTKQHHNPTPHHECKNTRHRYSAPTPHTAERYSQCDNKYKRKFASR
jgi:hypothetical protein